MELLGFRFHGIRPLGFVHHPGKLLNFLCFGLTPASFNKSTLATSKQNIANSLIEWIRGPLLPRTGLMTRQRTEG
jgi:hypothetical protein